MASRQKRTFYEDAYVRPTDDLNIRDLPPTQVAGIKLLLEANTFIRPEMTRWWDMDDQDFSDLNDILQDINRLDYQLSRLWGYVIFYMMSEMAPYVPREEWSGRLDFQTDDVNLKAAAGRIAAFLEQAAIEDLDNERKRTEAHILRLVEPSALKPEPDPPPEPTNDPGTQGRGRGRQPQS